MAGRQYKVKEVIDALQKSRGFVSAAAKILGCAPSTIYRHIEKSESVRTAIKDAREATKDMAELKLLNRINEGSDTAIIFYLKTQAKDRGYVEKQQVEHSGEMGVKGIDFTPYDGD